MGLQNSLPTIGIIMFFCMNGPGGVIMISTPFPPYSEELREMRVAQKWREKKIKHNFSSISERPNVTLLLLPFFASVRSRYMSGSIKGIVGRENKKKCGDIEFVLLVIRKERKREARFHKSGPPALPPAQMATKPIPPPF